MIPAFCIDNPKTCLAIFIAGDNPITALVSIALVLTGMAFVAIALLFAFRR